MNTGPTLGVEPKPSEAYEPQRSTFKLCRAKVKQGALLRSQESNPELKVMSLA